MSITANETKTSLINRSVVEVMSARTNLIERLLNLHDEGVRTKDYSLMRHGLGQAITELPVLEKEITEHLAHLSEWQVSAFHDQFNTLKARLNRAVDHFATTRTTDAKEN